ncbi:hypothetical protein ACHAWX_005152 [Stephanocyclus meneghinianus]
MISTWALIIAILRSPKVRRVPFNLYLLFSILPDVYKNTAGFAANLANLLMANESSNACTVIGWNDAYWWCANLWMACVVFFRLRELLLAVKNAKRHDPPKISRIVKESIIVHTLSAAIASLTLISVSWIPKATGLTGCEAYPQQGNMGQLFFYWVFFMPVTAFVPTLLVTALCIDVWWRNLLPVNGKTRSLLFYFARLLSVIYIVAIAVVVSFLFGGWVQAIAFGVFNLVGLFSVCLSLTKKDIMKAWNQMWRCQSPNEQLGPNGHSHAHIEPVDDAVSHFIRDVSICPLRSFQPVQYGISPDPSAMNFSFACVSSHFASWITCGDQCNPSETLPGLYPFTTTMTKKMRADGRRVLHFKHDTFINNIVDHAERNA